MNVNMDLNMDSPAHPVTQPATSSTAPFNPVSTISSATATATATAASSSNPLLFSASTTNAALNPNPHHAPAADPLQHLQQQQQQHAEPSATSASTSAAADLQSHVQAAALPSTNNYPHQVEGAGGPTATAPFLRDFSLVAEAAKRAQMSVVMRDLESVTL